MGRQVGFRLALDDLKMIDGWLRDHNGVVLVQPQSTSDLVISSTLDPVRRAWPIWNVSHHLLARKDDISAVSTVHVESGDYWLVNNSRSPVVELLFYPGAGAAVASGRFYFRTTFIDQTGDLGARHPVEFVRWADSLLRWVRRTWTKVDGVYVGPSVRTELSSA